jgi:hypothetical protein
MGVFLFKVLKFINTTIWQSVCCGGAYQHMGVVGGKAA